MSIYKTYKDDLGILFSEIYKPLRKRVPTKNKRKRIIVIAGPTGVGKTDLSISIAQILGGEIISADSMQIYKKMDIGTAKATQEQQQKIKHHLIDIREVKDSFNVSEYYNEAQRALREILANNHIPIVVGGSGFYLHALLYGPPLGPPSKPELRKKLEDQIDLMGPEVLYERLQILDPEYAKSITERDKHKIVRALEIIAITKMKVSDIPKPQKIESDIYDFRCWFLYMNREELYKKVDLRCDEMIENGLIDEIKILEEQGLCQNSSASQAIGYRQGIDYLSSPQREDDWERFVFQFKKASRNYVKRQFTWFKKEAYFRWLNLSEISFDRAKEYILQDYEQGI